MSRHWLTRRTEIGRNLGGNLGLDAAPVIIWSKPASSLLASDALATTQLETNSSKGRNAPADVVSFDAPGADPCPVSA